MLKGIIQSDMVFSDEPKMLGGSYFTIPSQHWYMHHFMNPYVLAQFCEIDMGTGFSALLPMQALVGSILENTLGVSVDNGARLYSRWQG